MARGGEDVSLVDPWPEHVEYIRANGMQLSGLTPAEKYSIKVNARHIGDVQQFAREKPIDIAFISVKSYDTEWATHLIKPYLAPGGYVVSLQNCSNEERIAAIVGWGKVLGTIVSLLASECYAPGHVKRTMPMGGAHYITYRVGEVHGRITPRAEEVTNILKHADSSKVTTDLWGEGWSKLVINSMRNGLSAATGLSGNQRDTSEGPRDVSIRLGSQAVRVGQALGFQLEKLQVMDAETLARAGEGSADAKTEIVDQLLKLATTRSEEQRPSMAQDIFKGRRTETDFINGFVAAKGEEIGVRAPLHAAMNALVKKVERGDVKPTPDLLQGL